MATRRPAQSAHTRGQPSRRRPIAVDLFSGAGGFSLGAEQAGFDVVAAVEYDPIHAAAHRYNFPDCEVLCADASTLGRAEIEASIRKGVRNYGRGTWCGALDLIVGGVPCQGFSAIGKRRPNDPRNQLAFSFLRIVRTLRPRYFLMENVQGMTSFVDPDGDGEATLLANLIAEFENSDYNVLPQRVLNASWFGVPQDRKRLILIGYRKGEAVPAYPEPVCRPVPKRYGDKPRAREWGHAKSPSNLPMGPVVWDAISDLPNIDEEEELITSDSLNLSTERRAELEQNASAYARLMRGLEDDSNDLSYRRIWSGDEMTGLMRTMHEKQSVHRFAKTPIGEVEKVSRYYRLDPFGLCSTLRAGTGYERGSFMAVRPIHPTYPRVIAVREAARLHSFPDWFGFHQRKWHGFRQIGNALPPLLGRAVAAQIVRALGVAPTKPRRVVGLGDRELLRLGTYAAATRFGADLERAPTHAKRYRKGRTKTTEAAPTAGRPLESAA